MKFMEKAKRFFTLNAAKHEGFTLVELIVVIAILAILAGVAVPAYSGYIKKAEKAGDMQLLGAVNEAFAAACMAEGVDIKTLTSGTARMPIVNGVIDLASVAPASVADDFALFYQGNETTKFKVVTALVFDTENFVFVDLDTVSSVTVSYAGSSITVSADTLLALKGSTFGQNMGSDALLNQIGTVTGAAAIMADSLDAVWADPSFKAAAMAAVGATTEEEYNAKTGAMVDQLIAQGKTPEEAMGQVQANAAVLYASQHAVNYTQEQIDALFTKGNADTVKNNLKGADTADGMAQAALVYGMYTAYANSSEYGSAELKEKAENPLTVLNALNNDDNFLAYVNSEQGKTDMAALQGSLGVVVDSTKNNESATTDLMLNGFNNDELKSIMSGLMG